MVWGRGTRVGKGRKKTWKSCLPERQQGDAEAAAVAVLRVLPHSVPHTVQ